MKDNKTEQTTGSQTNQQTGAKTPAAGSLSSLLGQLASLHLLVYPTTPFISYNSIDPPPSSELSDGSIILFTSSSCPLCVS